MDLSCRSCGGQCVRNGSGRMLCNACGKSFNTPERSAKMARAAADKYGAHFPGPEGHAIKGVSTLHGPDGEVKAQWVKTTTSDAEREELFREAQLAMVAELPKLKPRKAEGKWRKDLCVAYPIGDPHIGMLSWRPETGNDWDLALAERIHCAAMAELVACAPAAEQALIVNLGDALHYDSMEAITPRSGHFLDADGRYPKVIHIAIKVMRQCIESALSKHKRVHVINAPGNHDQTGALWLSAALSHTYEREPRVTIETSPAMFMYYRWGKCLIGVHHGHTCKPDKLPGVMASDRAVDWGETQHRYWYVGHVHHGSFKEHPGASVETFSTLAPNDAYAAAGGWRSRSQMRAIGLHKDRGEIYRAIVSADQFR